MPTEPATLLKPFADLGEEHPAVQAVLAVLDVDANDSNENTTALVCTTEERAWWSGFERHGRDLAKFIREELRKRKLH